MKKLLLVPLAVLALFLTTPVAQAQPAPRSPVGTWDCTLGGNQVGLAIVEFNADSTISGIQLIRPNPSRLTLPKVDIDPRHPLGERDRSGQVPNGGGTNTAPSTNFVGGNTLSGVWGYDSSGKVIGLLDQVSATTELVQKSITNVVDGTNMVVLTNVLETVFKTNAVSLRAVVVPGMRLSMTVFLPKGHNTYRGLPSIPLANLSGPLYAEGKRGGARFFEFLSAAPTGDLPNEYFLDGMGAGYQYVGFALVSRHRRIAVYTETTTPPFVITTYSGPFNLNTLRGSLKGRDTDGKNYFYKLVHQ